MDNLLSWTRVPPVNDSRVFSFAFFFFYFFLLFLWAFQQTGYGRRLLAARVSCSRGRPGLVLAFDRSHDQASPCRPHRRGRAGGAPWSRQMQPRQGVARAAPMVFFWGCGGDGGLGLLVLSRGRPCRASPLLARPWPTVRRTAEQRRVEGRFVRRLAEQLGATPLPPAADSAGHPWERMRLRPCVRRVAWWTASSSAQCVLGGDEPAPMVDWDSRLAAVKLKSSSPLAHCCSQIVAGPTTCGEVRLLSFHGNTSNR